MMNTVQHVMRKWSLVNYVNILLHWNKQTCINLCALRVRKNAFGVVSHSNSLCWKTTKILAINESCCARVAPKNACFKNFFTTSKYAVSIQSFVKPARCKWKERTSTSMTSKNVLKMLKIACRKKLIHLKRKMPP